MTIVRSKQKTLFTPAFVGGVLFFLLSVSLVVWFGSKVVQWVQDQQNAPIRQVRVFGDFGHIQPAQLHQQLQQQFVGNFFHAERGSGPAVPATTTLGLSGRRAQTMAWNLGGGGDRA